MSKVQIGKTVPKFKLPSTGGEVVTLYSLKGKTVVLYFYPKDDTPGCTTEGCGFRDHHAAFRKAGAVVLGVSRDSLVAVPALLGLAPS